MKKIIKFVDSLKLNQKITLFVLVVLAIPITALESICFSFLQKDCIRSKVENIRINMAKSQSTIQKNVEMCNLSTQVFLNTRSVMDYVISLKKGEKLDTQNVLDFYKADIYNLEKIVNSNPYLYKMRMYVNADMDVEMMPILYKYSRLQNLEWGKGGEIVSGNGLQVSCQSRTLAHRHFKKEMPHIHCTASPILYYSATNTSFPIPQIGQTQSSGRSSNAVPGAIPLSGSPTSGSYTYPHGSQTYFCILYSPFFLYK